MKFRGDYWFLSNMYPCEIVIGKYVFSCVEAAFAACKCPERVNEFVGLNGFDARALGRKVKLCPEWDKKKVGYMKKILEYKFKNPELMKKLKDTGDMYICEENSWGDRFWGVCNGEGKNVLGKLLMEIRDS